MKPLDYGLSFLIGKALWNEVRFWIESRTRIINEKTGKQEDYIQVGSCKSEDTFGSGDLFYDDNYDFIPIFGPDHGIIFRRTVYLNPRYKSCQPVNQMWEGQKYHLVEAKLYEELFTTKDIIKATKVFYPIVAQTEIQNKKTGLRAIIEYPVKTMNTCLEQNSFQVDTGPIAFPDLTQNYERYVDSISLAFIAFNNLHKADFILEVPTPITDKNKEICKVHHYSLKINLTTTNHLYALLKSQQE
jgi:hypothetical protein